jgi:hypothetical protein
MPENSIRTISGTLVSISNAVSTTHAQTANVKSNSQYKYDYIEIDDTRWANMAMMGSVNDCLVGAIGDELTIHYIETVVNKKTLRMIVGIEKKGEKMEAILVEDASDALKALKTMRNIRVTFGLAMWSIVGGLISLAIGSSSSMAFGIGAYAAGFFGFYSLLGRPTKNSIAFFDTALSFAKAHNRLV